MSVTKKVEVDLVRMKLTVAIRSGDGVELTDELVFHPPKGEDIMAIGNPTRIKHYEDDSLSQEADTFACGKYISRLCRIPMSSVKALDPVDFVEAANVVLGFFQRKTGTS